MRILVVDDDYVSRTKLKTILAAYGDCDAVPDGDLGYAMFCRAHEDNVPYDLISMDVDMPNVSGHEVVKKIREWETEKNIYATSKEVKILMVTVKDNPKEIMESFREGVEFYIIKPFSKDKIQNALTKVGLLKT